MKQMTKEEAIAFGESGVWKNLSQQEIVGIQLFQKFMCVPFRVFESSIYAVFGDVSLDKEVLRNLFIERFELPEDKDIDFLLNLTGCI